MKRLSIRRKFLLSNLATAIAMTGVVRIVIAWLLNPALQALPTANLQAQRLLDDFTVVLLFSALVSAVVTCAAFEWIWRRRISSFGETLHDAAGTPRSAQVPTQSDTDMAALAKPVNQLLGSLQSAQAELAERQQQLSISEQRLSLALEATGDGLWDYYRDGRTFFSDTYYRMLGYPPEGDNLQPENWLKLVHPADLPVVQEATLAVRTGKSDLLAVEMRMLTAAGQWKWVFLRGRVIQRGPGGVPQRMLGTAQDVDRRRKAEQAIRENQEVFRNAFEESAIGMALVRPDGRLMRTNSPFCDILGFTEYELTQLTFQDITHPDDVDEDVELLHALLRGERQHYTMEKRYIRKDGAVVWALLNVGVVLDAAHKPIYLISQVQDITQRKQNEDDLHAYAQRLLDTKEELERSTSELATKTAEAEAAQLVAEQANRTKSAFLANMSHEIRTPMAAIIGFANLLLDKSLPPHEARRSIETIARNGQHLLALINDVLDLSKIEADKMTVEYIACDPSQIVADVEAMCAGRAFDKNLRLTVKIASDVPRRVRTDPTRLRQVLLNLVSNAIKFTSQGEVRVELSRRCGAGEMAGLRFVVTDTGIGMDDEQLGRLFEPFTQGDVSTTRRFGGTGLGLAISKRLVEMMRGHIIVCSEAGKGTRFEVTIDAPLCGIAPAAPTATAPTVRPGLRVLLAEDGPDNQRLITFYLQHAGIQFDVAENGRICVDRAIDADSAGRPFDLVLMDMQMPELDGVAATAALRAAGLQMPIIALTAHSTEEAHLQSLRAGCCEHLVKPVNHDTLMHAIAIHTAINAAAGEPMALTSELSDDPRFKALIDGYIAELPEQVSVLIELSHGDRDISLRRLLHQIKGAGGGYGLSALSAAAGAAQAAFDDSDVNSLGKSVDQLIRLMRSVQGYDSGRERLHAAARIDH